MSRHLTIAAPIVSIALVASILAGCGAAPNHVSAAATTVSSASIKAEANTRKLTRAQAEAKAKQLIAEFDNHNWRSINARTEAVKKIANTDSQLAYDFLLEEVATVQDLRDEMKNITKDDADTYEEMLSDEVDQMTPDQEVVKKRVAKAEALKMDLDELTVSEEQNDKIQGASNETFEAKWGGGAHVGSRNRLLTAIQESKVYKFVKRAYKNTRRWIKHTLKSLCQKLHFCS
ncbi:MAG: hypothetical protein JWM80_6699 [Cyanobacteria bacterium RYN_339]|nr:hypothetical protein [Cyanobacteria bacterium RYN_339]